MTGTPREPMPSLCSHDDHSWCNEECEEKARKFDEWMRVNLRKERAPHHVRESRLDPDTTTTDKDTSMLILTRRTGEQIDITAPDGTRIAIVQLGVKGNQVRYGIEAPRSWLIDRHEITKRKAGDEPNGNQ